GLASAERQEVLDLFRQIHDDGSSSKAENDGVVRQVRELYERAQVFDKAEKLVDKYRARAEGFADEAEPTELRELLYFLVDTILDRRPLVEESEALVQLNA